MKTILDLDALRVETFEPEPAEVRERDVPARTPHCSAIDLCPTRPC